MKAKQVATILAIVMAICLIAQIKIVNADNLTLEEIEERNGKLIIERVVGTVIDNNKNGCADHDDSYYICYNRVSNASVGSKICTYFVYNPFTNYVDDIIFRFDYIIENDV